MSLKLLLLIFFIVFLINKLLDGIIKFSKEVMTEKRENLNLSVKKDFNKLIINYLENIGYSNVEKPQNGIVTVYNGEDVTLVGHKQTKKNGDELAKEDLIMFIASMNMKSVKNGLFLTNGVISNDIKEIINSEFKDEVNLKIIEGLSLVINLKKIKIQELKEKNI